MPELTMSYHCIRCSHTSHATLSVAPLSLNTAAANPFGTLKTYEYVNRTGYSTFFIVYSIMFLPLMFILVVYAFFFKVQLKEIDRNILSFTSCDRECFLGCLKVS